MISENNNFSKHGTVIKRFYGYDQIHFNQNGSRVLAAKISRRLKSMMGIPFCHPGFHSHKRSRFRRSRYKGDKG